MYSIEEISRIYDEYDEDGYETDDSELLCSTAYVITNDNMDNIDNLKLSEMVVKDCNVDYVLVKQSGNIAALHISHEYYKDGILKNGLCAGDGDFGYGLYAIEKDDFVALDNLKTWVCDEFRCSEDNLVVCNIKYSGEYYKCITKGSNEGYLLLDENLVKVESIDTVPIDGFLSK